MGVTVRDLRVAALALAALLASCSGGSEPSDSELSLVALGPNAAQPAMFSVFVLVHGVGFRDGAVVERDGEALETSFVSGTRLAALLPREVVEVPATFTLRVRNPDGEVSNGLPFVVSADANPLVVDSVSPANLAEVNAGSALAVYLSDGLDQASLTDTSIVVRDETGALVSGTVSYDEEASVLRWTGELPGAHRYAVAVADDIRTPAGGALGGQVLWSFTTTLGVTVLLETAGSWPAMVPGGNGWPRVAYRTDSRLRLATCTGSCATPALWGIADVGQLPGADYVTLAIAANGTLHLGFQDPSGLGATYATPAGQAVLIPGEAAYTSIGVSPSGALHLLYYRQGDLYHATCASACGLADNWQQTVVDSDGDAGSFTSVAVDPQGGVHATYFESGSGDLRYAVCAAPCATPTWLTGSVATAGRVGIGSSLLVDGTGVLHASWIDETAGDVVYGTCAASCTTADAWSRATVDHIAESDFFFGWSYTSLARGPNGLDLSYHDAIGFGLRGASCAADCTAQGAWTTFTVSLYGPTDFSNRMTSLRVDGGGDRHVVWTDRSSGVRYTKY